MLPLCACMCMHFISVHLSLQCALVIPRSFRPAGGGASPAPAAAAAAAAASARKTWRRMIGGRGGLGEGADCWQHRWMY
jgi:hypothetical protein